MRDEGGEFAEPFTPEIWNKTKEIVQTDHALHDVCFLPFEAGLLLVGLQRVGLQHDRSLRLFCTRRWRQPSPGAGRVLYGKTGEKR